MSGTAGAARKNRANEPPHSHLPHGKSAACGRMARLRNSLAARRQRLPAAYRSYRTTIDEIRLFQVCPSRNLRVRRSATLPRNSSLPPLKLRSLKTNTRDPPKICSDEMLSPKSPGRLSSLSPLTTQKRSPRNPASLKKQAPARGTGRSFHERSHLGWSR